MSVQVIPHTACDGAGCPDCNDGQQPCANGHRPPIDAVRVVGGTPYCHACGDLLMDGKPGPCPRCATEDLVSHPDY